MAQDGDKTVIETEVSTTRSKFLHYHAEHSLTSTAMRFLVILTSEEVLSIQQGVRFED